jgi:hypothetical protein
MEGDIITLQDLFLFDFGMGVDDEGNYKGRLKATGIRPTFSEDLEPRESGSRPTCSIPERCRWSGEPSSWWWPAAVTAQSGELEIVEVNTSRYDEGGNVTMVLGFRNLAEQLNPEQLSITADGGAVENLVVEPLAQSTVPVGVVLAIDTSGSMEGEPIAAARDAARSFVNQKRPEDFVAIVTFDDEVRVLQGFTNNTSTLLDRIDTIEPRGATAFNDAIIRSIQMFQDPSASRLQPNIIVLADGADNGITGLGRRRPGRRGRIRTSGCSEWRWKPPTSIPTPCRRWPMPATASSCSPPSPDQLSGLFGQIQAEINNVLVARFTVPRTTPGEMAFAVDYGALSATATARSAAS